MSRRVGAAVSLLLISALGTMAPPVASAETRDEFAVISSEQLQIGDAITREELAGLGIGNETLSAAPANLDAPATDDSPMLLTYNAWAVGDEWWDSSHRSVVLRNGSWDGASGWGWKKIYNYHNLTSTSMKAVTRNYFAYEREGSTENYHYFARALRFSCGVTCYVSDARDVKLIVDRRVLSDGKTRGIFNGYCVQSAVQCPHWVNNAWSSN